MEYDDWTSQSIITLIAGALERIALITATSAGLSAVNLLS